MKILSAVAIGGAVGSLARYYASIWIGNRIGHAFPYGTALVNLSGSFLLGVIVQIFMRYPLGFSSITRVFVVVGVLGGYTTFSGFAYETLSMISEGEPLAALIYAFGSIGMGVGAAAAGMFLARALI